MLRYTEDVSSQMVFHLGEACGMQIWNYQEMSGVDGLNVHEGSASIIPVNDAGWQLTR